MSVARLHTVQKAQKDQGRCGTCGKDIAKGDAYQWFKHFRGYKQTFHLGQCTPPTSRRESSSLSEVYAAQETLEADANQAATPDELTAAWEEFASALTEYAEARREAADAWEHGNSQLEEQADAAETAASEAESAWQVEEYDGETDADDAPLDADAYEEWLQEQRDAAIDAASSVEL